MICTGYTLQSTRIRFSKCRVPVADTPTFILCTYTVCGINSNKIADHFKVTTAAAELVSVEFRSAHKKLLLQFLIFHLPPPFNKNHHFTMSTPSNQTPPIQKKAKKWSKVGREGIQLRIDVAKGIKDGTLNMDLRSTWNCTTRIRRCMEGLPRTPFETI